MKDEIKRKKGKKSEGKRGRQRENERKEEKRKREGGRERGRRRREKGNNKKLISPDAFELYWVWNATVSLRWDLYGELNAGLQMYVRDRVACTSPARRLN